MARSIAGTREIEPVWVHDDVILEAHEQQLREHGGPTGVRDPHAFAGAMARPQYHFSYTTPPPSLAELAALYAIGIARNHPFVDGNKRSALIALVTFLELNGHSLNATNAEAVEAIRSMASRDFAESDFTAWIVSRVRTT